MAGLEALLARHWWRPRPDALAQALRPLSWLYAALAWLHALPWRAGWRRPEPTPVPVIVVGNLVAGGAGKTPVVIALVEALRAAGRQPGVISRGYGRRSDEVAPVQATSTAAAVGDEPLLIHRRTAAPVQVGRRRLEAARALCKRHPEIDVIVADDGLQHHALARAAEVLVFDARGAGNGLRLPAGPLREPLPRSPGQDRWVLYNAERPTTPLPGATFERRLGHAVALADWHAGRATAAPLSSLRGRRLVAAAGIATPERFFAMLEAAGLDIERLPLPDHHDFASLPWPPGTPEVLVTEKDAVKLDPARCAPTAVWVMGLDSRLPTDFVQSLLARLGPPLPP